MLLSAGSDVNALCARELADSLEVRRRHGRELPYAKGDPRDTAMPSSRLLRAGADANPPEWRGTTVICQWQSATVDAASGRYSFARARFCRLVKIPLLAVKLRYSPDAPLLCRKCDAAGGFPAYEKAHPRDAPGDLSRRNFRTSFPPELVPHHRRVSFHVGTL